MIFQRQLICNFLMNSLQVVIHTIIFMSEFTRGLDEPSVKTKTSTIIGKYVQVSENRIEVFLGVPYAKPPLGDKRFSKADPLDTFEDTIYATKMPPACMQLSNRTEIPFVPPLSLNKSEDCLFVNIWVPANQNQTNSSKLPVLVWYYGGGFHAGSISMDLYDGSVLANLGEVIVVTVNYRLGVFGFLYGGSDEAPGNVGIYDSLLALQWINDNIVYFGGDPNQITIFGESAGAITVSIFLLLPSAQKLFSKAIMESGSIYSSRIFNDNESALNRTNIFAEVVGCTNETTNMKNNPTEVMKCLKSKDASELSKAEMSFTWKTFFYFGPVVGYNDSLSTTVLENVNNTVKKPFMIGFNQNEGVLPTVYMFPELLFLNSTPTITLNEAKSAIQNSFGASPESEEVINLYLQNITDDDSDKIAAAVSNVFADYATYCGCLYFAEKGENAYLYQVSHRSTKDKCAEWVGVTHFGEIPYIFGIPFTNSSEYTSEDQIFSHIMIETWSSFAKNSHPMGENVWPEFTSKDPQVYDLSLKTNGTLLPFSKKDECEFWRPFITNSIVSEE